MGLKNSIKIMKQKRSNNHMGGRVHKKTKRKRKSEIRHIICSEIDFSINIKDENISIQFKIILDSLNQRIIVINHHRWSSHQSCNAHAIRFNFQSTDARVPSKLKPLIQTP